ncbi:hypothetical protein KBY67_05605 [Synechococcus sp. RedBA-s]|nr:hypothetical protein [Synechococcus sp. RedBA-s]
MTHMPEEVEQLSAPEGETSSGPKDLRAELEADLKTEFSANLSAVGTLPKVVCDSLVALLDSSAPASVEVLESLALEDPTQPEMSNE